MTGQDEDDGAELPRFLLNLDGSSFDHLAEETGSLDALSYPDRVTYRNGNAEHIARADVDRLLIVAGPGTGKTILFISRITYWLERHTERICVATFVRKLVRDLEGDLERLPRDQRRAVDASTLHTLARSLLERGRGSRGYPMNAFIRVIDAFWADVVWDDVLAFHPGSHLEGSSTKQLEDQFHADAASGDGDWPAVIETYRLLCQFYNAVGFAYFIVFALEAVTERPELNIHKLWIIDEYQDFNPAEDHLITALTHNSLGLLIAGDDEQALYQTLKAASPDIIIGHYADITFAKAMLPFCSRCEYYICLAASRFMAKHRQPTAIDKVYLPLHAPADALRVSLVAAPTATSAVDYVRKFLEDNAASYDEYLTQRKEGRETDPFLLILSASGALTLGKTSKEDEELEQLVAAHAEDAAARSSAYLRVATYAAAAFNLNDNFAVRKVLHYEDLSIDRVHFLVDAAIQRRLNLWSVVSTEHTDIADRLYRVREVLEDAAPPEHTAERLIALLRLRDAGDLARELTEFPLRRRTRELEDDEAIETAGALPPVALMTMNGAKGLSAKHVIVVGCDDMNMRYTTPLAFFVALTRARRSLHLVASRKTGGSAQPHQFLLDLPDEACRFVEYKKTDRAEVELNDRAGLASSFENWAAGEKYGRQQQAAKKQRKR